MKVLIRLIPFSFRRRHASKSSVVDDHASTSRSSKSAEANTLPRGDEDGLSSSTKVRMKRNPFGFVGLRKSRMSTGIRRLINSMKNCSSQLFVYRLDMEEEDEEEAMEIGYPTDVKHVTHIGLDGTTTTTTTTSNTTNCALKSWQNLKPPEIISLPSITFKQFELAMAAQVHAQK